MAVFCRKSKLCKSEDITWIEYKDRLKSDYNIKSYNLIGTTIKSEVDYFVQVYKFLIYEGTHDQGFVNLYHIKKHFRKSFWSFRDLVQSVICSRIVLGVKKVHISNITYGVDRSKRYKLYNGSAVIGIKIKIEL